MNFHSVRIYTIAISSMRLKYPALEVPCLIDRLRYIVFEASFVGRAPPCPTFHAVASIYE